jgi:2'-5' RNA ligase
MPRLFVGVELSDQVRLLLEHLSKQMSEHVDDAKWIPRENMHITVKFLGDTPDAKIEAIKTVLYEVAERFRRFSITLDKPGCFPKPEKANVLWVGLRFGASELEALAKEVDASLSKLGYDTEKRAFRPHITVARIKTPANVCQLFDNLDYSAIKGSVVNISALTLFKSVLSPKGAKYEVISRVPLSS